MTAKEAIIQLEDLIRDRESFMVGDYDKDIYDRDKEALGFAVKAVEKQIPKKLKLCPFCADKPYTQVRANGDKIVLKIGCGNCGTFLTETALSGTNFTRFDEIRNKLIEKWNRRAENA